MRVKPEQLGRHLAGELAPIYVVTGDEPLQVEESLDAIRAAARGRGFTERVVLDVDASFDWDTLRQHADSLSLFADRKLIDVRMPGGKPGDEGAAALRDLASRPSPDNLVLIGTRRLDGKVRQTRWFKALESAGAVVQVWPVESAQLPGWIARRASAAGVKITPDAARLLAELTEGNLLACAQEVEKLALAGDGARVDAEDLMRSVAESARFGVFDLVDTALSGDARRTARILRVLRDEGVDPRAVLGPLAWLVRSAAAMSGLARAGEPLERVLAQPRFGAWRRRRGLLERALARHGHDAWLAFLDAAYHLDRMLKGAMGTRDAPLKARPDDPWNALARLTLGICGVRLPRG